VIRDITRLLGPGLQAWPGDPPFEVETVALLARGDVFEVTRLSMSLHTGSHLDAPSHVIEEAGDLGSVPLELLIGPARLIHVPVSRPISRADLEGALGLSPGAEAPAAAPFTRLLLRTESAESLHHDVMPAFATLTEEAAAFLIRIGVRVVGIDTPSVDPPDSADPSAHRLFARSGTAILEWLDLKGVAPGSYYLIALPLRLKDVEASPVRAVLLDAAPDLASLGAAGAL
jgi:arylformamidase